MVTYAKFGALLHRLNLPDCMSGGELNEFSTSVRWVCEQTAKKLWAVETPRGGGDFGSTSFSPSKPVNRFPPSLSLLVVPDRLSPTRNDFERSVPSAAVTKRKSRVSGFDECCSTQFFSNSGCVVRRLGVTTPRKRPKPTEAPAYIKIRGFPLLRPRRCAIRGDSRFEVSLLSAVTAVHVTTHEVMMRHLELPRPNS